jgi:hypothetical protein
MSQGIMLALPSGRPSPETPAPRSSAATSALPSCDEAAHERLGGNDGRGLDSGRSATYRKKTRSIRGCSERLKRYTEPQEVVLQLFHDIAGSRLQVSTILHHLAKQTVIYEVFLIFPVSGVKF